MKNLTGLFLLFVIIWGGIRIYDNWASSSEAVQLPQRKAAQQTFQCDGREYCSQMTSCAQAKYFIQNCPNTKMDGDRDGVPCEKQWCRK